MTNPTLSPNSFTPEQVAALSAKSGEVSTPDLALQAMRPRPSVVAGITLLPVTLDTFIQLEIARSPLLVGGDISVLDIGIALFILAIPAPEVDAVLDDRTKLVTAARGFCRHVEPASFAALAAGLQAHIHAATATAIKTSPDSASEKKTDSGGN